MRESLLCKLTMTLVLALGVVVAPAAAEAYIGTNGYCCPENGYYASVEALYWRPSHDPIFVDIRFNVVESPERDIDYVTGRYDWGGRGRVGFRCSSWFVDAAYLYLRTSDGLSTVNTPFDVMLPLGGGAMVDTNLDFVESEVRYRYQNVDVRFGKDLYNGCGALAFVYLNARWVKLDFKNDIDGIVTGTTDPFAFSQDSHFNGGGFGAGINGHYLLCGGLGIGARFGLLAVAGCTDFDFNSSQAGANAAEVFLIERKKWGHLFPAFEYRIGLDYTYCCRCCCLTFEVGYEANYYFSILHYASENDHLSSGAGRVPELREQDVGFSGLVLRAGLGF